MGTKVNILQHNRLDANSFVSVKLYKANKKTTDIFERSNKNCRYGDFFSGNWKLRNVCTRESWL